MVRVRLIGERSGEHKGATWPLGGAGIGATT
jgi:hypothetical protein